MKRHSHSRKKTRGYSLIELVAVTMTSGVLAASALPHFIDLRDEARHVVFKGLQRSILQAANMAHAQQRLSGLSANQAIYVEGKRIEMHRAYPTKAALGLLVENSDFDYHPDKGWFVWKHAANEECRQSYIPASSGALRSPKVSSEESGC